MTHPALDRLPGLLAAQRRRRAFAAALRVLWILLAVHLVVLAVLGWFSLRYPLAPGWLEAMGWSFLVYLGFPLAFAWARSSRANARETVARELDHANPAAPDPFRTALSLGNHDEATLGDLDRLFAAYLPRLSFPRPRLLPIAQRAALAIACAAFLAAAFLSHRPGEFFARTASPWRALGSLPTLRFEVDAPALTLGAGDTATVAGTVRNRLPDQPVFAYVRTAAGETRYPIVPASDGRFAFSHGPVDSDFTLSFAGDNGRSRSLSFRVVAPPFLARLQAVLHPPGYTRLKPDTLPAGVTRFPVLPGTRVEWLIEADRPLKRSAWSFRPVPEGNAEVSGTGRDTLAARPPAVASEDTLGPGRAFTVAREIRKAVDYSFWLEDEEGIRSRPSIPFRIELAPDLPPEVELVQPSADTLVDRDGKLALGFRAKDDFGIASFKLAWKVLADGKPRAEGQRDARDWLRAATAGSAQAVWDLSSLRLKPEETVEFHLAATDNDTVNGPKIGRSAVRRVRMPTLEEVLAATHRNEQSAEANLKSALQRSKQLERKLEREKEAPREEGPPMLADFEINRIMVDDPREHRQRTASVVGQLQQALGAMAKPSGRDNSGEAGKDLSQAQTAAKELQDFLSKSEEALPRGNQGMLPAEDKRKNLERLMEQQKEQAAKLSALRDKLDKAAPRKPDPAQARQELAKMQLNELAKDLEKNLQNQSDLKKLFKEQESQAKAKSDLMDQAIQEQMRMAQDMKSANDDLKKAADAQSKNGLLSPELIEKMKKVQDLLHEVLPDSLQKLMENKLRGQEVDEKELKERLQEMLEKQAELAEQLNRALAMLEQLKDRKRMEELRQALGDLKDREEAVEKDLRAGKTGAEQDAEQKAIAQETQKALSDFSNQAAGRKGLQDMNKQLKPGPVQQDMQDVRQSLASAKGKSGPQKASAASSAAQSASSAAGKLAQMGDMLGQAMAGMGESFDPAEASEILQESLALSRQQLLIRSGSAHRQAEGWQADEATLYAGVAQNAGWIQERVKALAAKIPFFGDGLNAQARGLAQSAREASRLYTWETADKALRFNQNLSRELIKLLKMAQNSGGGGNGAGSGSDGDEGEGKGQGKGKGQGSGDLASELKSMSGKQMAINQATYQLLQAMMQGRSPGQQGRSSGGQQGQGEQQGEDGQGGQEAGQGGEGGDGSLGGMANKQGELGEKLEGMAEGQGEEGGTAQKLRSLAEEARKLEDDLRQGRITAEELKRRQDRFQSRLLEASNAMQERGQSESRQAETSKGNRGPAAPEDKAAAEARLLQLLRDAKRDAKGMRLSEGQRKRLDEYYETLLTR